MWVKAEEVRRAVKSEIFTGPLNKKTSVQMEFLFFTTVYGLKSKRLFEGIIKLKN